MIWRLINIFIGFKWGYRSLYLKSIVMLWTVTGFPLFLRHLCALCWYFVFMQLKVWKLQCILQIDTTEIVRIDYEQKKNKYHLMLRLLESGARCASIVFFFSSNRINSNKSHFETTVKVNMWVLIFLVENVGQNEIYLKCFPIQTVDRLPLYVSGRHVCVCLCASTCWANSLLFFSKRKKNRLTL